MIDKRPIGDSGISVAPLALGGNVFDWTADEAASFAAVSYTHLTLPTILRV